MGSCGSSTARHLDDPREARTRRIGLGRCGTLVLSSFPPRAMPSCPSEMSVSPIGSQPRRHAVACLLPMRVVWAVLPLGAGAEVSA